MLYLLFVSIFNVVMLILCCVIVILKFSITLAILTAGRFRFFVIVLESGGG